MTTVEPRANVVRELGAATGLKIRIGPEVICTLNTTVQSPCP